MKAHNASTIVDPVCSFKRAVVQTVRSAKPAMRFNSPCCRSGVGVPLVVAVAAFVLLVFASPYVFYDGSVASASTESISTVASSDCTTPKSQWALGQTACAVVTGGSGERRIVWIAPDGAIAQVSPAFSDTGEDRYTLLSGPDPLAQTGTWKVESMDNAGSGFAVATFLVLDPGQTSNADLSILKFGPLQAVASDSISYTIQATNRGPDTALTVVVSESVPNNTTFVSETQNSGPTATCTNPNVGQTGTSTCIMAGLALNEIATFTFVYNVNSGTPVDTRIFNTATVSSSTNELFQGDNMAGYRTGVVSPPSPSTCTINCPTIPPVDNTPASLCSVVVTYGTPTTSGNCADLETGQTPPVVCSPPSGTAFPVGTTSVVCSSGGNSCSSQVTVHDIRPPVQPTITCPANVTVNETFLGAGSATVNYAAPTTTGNCVTVTCSPPAGSSFPVGTTPVACTGTDASNNSVACSFDVAVFSGNCLITCPGDITATTVANQCSAVVTYQDPSASISCGTVVCKDQDNSVRHSGDAFPIGVTDITCTSDLGPTCSFAATVTGQQVIALSPANVWIGLKNSDDVGTKFDLLAEVFRNGALIGSGELDGVSGGSSGFNNAILRTIDLALSGPVDFCSGNTLSLRLSVRIAVDVPGHRSGTARLWFNDNAANSRFGTTIGSATNNYFLLDGFVLDTAAGPGPKKTVDVFVDRAADGNPFKPFGTWSKTF
jgi:uncharacterized repeat protein (TIGR01451 family)